MQSKQVSENSSLRAKKETLALFEDDDSIDELVALKLSAQTSSKVPSHDQKKHALFDAEDVEEINCKVSTSVTQPTTSIAAKSTLNVHITKLRGNLFDDEEELFPAPAGDAPKVGVKHHANSVPIIVSKSLFDEDDEESMFESKYYEERALRIQLESKVTQLESKLALLENKLFKYEPDFDWKDVRIPSFTPRSVASGSKRSVRLSLRGPVDLLPDLEQPPAAPSPSGAITSNDVLREEISPSSNIDNDDEGPDTTESSSLRVSKAAVRRQRRYAATVGAKSARRRNLRATAARSAASDPVDASNVNKNGESSPGKESVIMDGVHAAAGPPMGADADPLSSATGEAYSDTEQPESKCSWLFYGLIYGFLTFSFTYFYTQTLSTRWTPPLWRSAWCRPGPGARTSSPCSALSRTCIWTRKSYQKIYSTRLLIPLMTFGRLICEYLCIYTPLCIPTYVNIIISKFSQENGQVLSP
jgi:hypothetical protein